jgi:hypothetical protein
MVVSDFGVNRARVYCIEYKKLLLRLPSVHRVAGENEVLKYTILGSSVASSITRFFRIKARN